MARVMDFSDNQDAPSDRKVGIGHNGSPPLIETRNGWVAISREMRTHWLVGFGQAVRPMDPEKGALSRAEAWIDLIMECKYEAGSVRNGGARMDLFPGQMLGAVSWLANRWNWTPKTVRGFLDKLVDDGMIELAKPGVENGEQKGKQSSVLTVCNYSDYQVVRGSEGLAEGTQRASKGQAKGNIYKDNTSTREQGNKEERKDSDAPPAAEPKAKKSKNVSAATFLPDDWICSKALGEFIMRSFQIKASDVRIQAADFKTYWLNRRDAKAKKPRWDLAFHSWIRKAGFRPNATVGREHAPDLGNPVVDEEAERLARIARGELP